MIQYIKVTNCYGESVKIVLTNEDPKHGFLLKSIDGLGPAKANINTGKYATADGSFYNSARLDPRNIVMTLFFGWADTIEETRLNTYKYFPIKRYVDLLIKTDERLVKTRGYVESNEPNIFSDAEEAKISIICPDPFFYANKNSVVYFSHMEDLFEFPIHEDETFETGLYNTTQDLPINYEGDVDVGVTINVTLFAPIGDFTVSNTTTGETLTIYNDRVAAFTGSSLAQGDKIQISTERGSKKVTLTRNNQKINILNCLGTEMDWIHLQRGVNDFYINAANGNANVDVRIEHKVAYEGV